jgi:DNA repair protein RadC
MAIRELHVSFSERTPVNEANGPIRIKSCKDVVSLMAPLLEPEVVEVCYVVCLTTPMDLIGYHLVSRGSLSEASLHPREVYKVAMLANAASIVVVHNHPSGDPTPSPDDLAVTARLKAVGEILGIELLDHIVIGHQGRHASLRQDRS